MKDAVAKQHKETEGAKKKRFDPFRLITNEEFCSNLKVIIEYYEAIRNKRKEYLIEL